MKKTTLASLPPIAVEERPEKLTLSLPSDLKQSMEQFGQFFADVGPDADLLQRRGGRHSHGLSRGPRRLSEVAESPLAR